MSEPESSPDFGTGALPPRPGTQPSAPSASGYMPELPYAEELQALLEGKYIVENFLGQGGMGAVYKGLQLPLKRPVAIKILAKRQDGVEDEFAFEERFKREAYAMAALTHPNIVQVYDCGDAGPHFLFISMELVEGGDLSDAMKNKLIPPEVALAMIGPICDGLQAAHEHGLVHRDIKPANIFLTADGRPKVADFGLAKKFDVKSTFVTKTGLGMGTPDYAAPEQFEGATDLDHRADIYALGVMFYQMLTGRLPRGAYKPPSRRVPVDPRLDEVVSRAMQPDRNARYQSTAEMRADIDRIVATWMAVSQPIPTQTAAVPTVPRTTSPVTRPATSAPVRRSVVPTHTSAVPARAKTRVAQPQPALAPQATKTKSSTGMLVGGLGAIAIIAAGAFFALKKPPPEVVNSPAASAYQVESAQVSSSESSSSTPSAPTAAVATPAATMTSHWVDGLEQWREWKKGNVANSSIELNDDGTVLMTGYGGIKAGPDPLPAPRDVAVRVRGRLMESPDSFLRVNLRQQRTIPNDREIMQYEVRLMRHPQSVRLSFVIGNRRFFKLTEWETPPGFDPNASHILECRAVGDVLTVLLDGMELGNWRDSQMRDGNFAVGGRIVLIEGFEYAHLVADGGPPVHPAAPLEFGGHKYDLVVASANWHEATLRAEAMGGRLITINSREEQEWMEQTLLPLVAKAGFNGNPRFPMGAERKRATEAWTWTTGAPLSFSSWRNGAAPDNPNENDLVLDGICEKDFSKVVWDDVPKGAQTQREFFFVEWGADEGAVVQPVVAAAPAGAVDLLALVDVARDAVKGAWEQTPEGLLLKRTPGPQLLEIQFAPPAEYDFEIEFSAISGSMEAAQAVPMHSETLLWKMGCGGTDPGFYTFGPRLDGKMWRDAGRAAPSPTRPRMVPNERHRSLLEVRKGSIRAVFDGEELLNWSGDITRYKGEPGFELPNPAHLGLGSWNTEIVFHKVELRPPSSASSAAARGPIPGSGASVDPQATMRAGSAAPDPTSAIIAADPRLAKLDAGFRTRYEADTQKPFLGAVSALNKSYLANGVARAQAAAKVKGNVDEVAAFDEVKARIERGEGVLETDPPGTPESLKALRNIYRTEYAKLESERAKNAAPLYDMYLRALDVYVVELTKANKIPIAQKVQDLRDAIAGEAARMTGAKAPP